MKPAILPMIIALSLSACGSLNPSIDYLRNPAVDAKYSWTYTDDTPAGRQPDRLSAETNLTHAGYRFAWAVGKALQYREVVPLDLAQSLQYWTDRASQQKADLEKVKGKPQEALMSALLNDSEHNKAALTQLKQANLPQLAVLHGNGLLAVPRYQALQEMWQSGINFADLSCARFFDAASRQQTSRDFFGKEVQLLAGLTSAVQGVTGVSSKVISATASSFSFGQSAMSAYETTLALAPDIYLLQKAVQVKKRKLRSDLDKPGLFAGSYYDVEQALLAYAEPCNFSGLKSIINEALQEKNQQDQ
ncbi:hypothetical protein PQU95_05710 [Vogesella sp. DC21W]|uniref:Lipoprotein n=1 Tax=Vogesella aquatica TaxID=2984206 RepID=A0ABT5IVW7_9NEIS|nr:hypothetical protein [Vogesella aquatica]MDC7716710.1 hypothetical protein [Vogesella aquatica]